MLNGPCEHVDNFVYAIGDEKYPPYIMWELPVIIDRPGTANKNINRFYRLNVIFKFNVSKQHLMIHEKKMILNPYGLYIYFNSSPLD